MQYHLRMFQLLIKVCFHAIWKCFLPVVILILIISQLDMDCSFSLWHDFCAILVRENFREFHALGSVLIPLFSKTSVILYIWQIYYILRCLIYFKNNLLNMGTWYSAVRTNLYEQTLKAICSIKIKQHRLKQSCFNFANILTSIWAGFLEIFCN